MMMITSNWVLILAIVRLAATLPEVIRIGNDNNNNNNDNFFLSKGNLRMIHVI